MAVQIKICGVTTEAALTAARPADFVGFVFHDASPRAITPSDAGRLAQQAGRLRKVGLFVDPDDARLAQTLASVPLDLIQLHGDETPQRVRDIAGLTGRPGMKALRVASAADIEPAQAYEQAADWLLFDAKVAGAYGGTGHAFDWSLLRGFRSARPWMLSGGLNAANIGAALAVLQPDAIDVSSGVESARGQKDPALIEDFIRTVRAF